VRQNSAKVVVKKRKKSVELLVKSIAARLKKRKESKRNKHSGKQLSGKEEAKLIQKQVRMEKKEGKNNEGQHDFETSSKISSKNALVQQSASASLCLGDVSIGIKDGPSQVLKRLWLGNREDAEDEDFLRKSNIRYVGTFVGF
jgi:hypothetical protein